MLKNDWLFAKIGADTAENEPVELIILLKIRRKVRYRIFTRRREKAEALLPGHGPEAPSSGLDERDLLAALAEAEAPIG